MSATIGVVLILIGALHLAFPYASWFLSIGWKIRDAEPSDAYLALTRAGGGVAMGIGAIVIAIALTHPPSQTPSVDENFAAFASEMTVKNISAIQDPNGSAEATPAQIREFVNDIHEVTSPFNTPSGDGAAAAGSLTITCRDGYQATFINVDNDGTFGITNGAAWVTPDYEFTSQPLSVWIQQVGPSPAG